MCAFWLSPFLVVKPSLGEFSRGEGQRSNAAGRSAGGGDKKFLQSFRKKFLAEFISPLVRRQGGATNSPPRENGREMDTGQPAECTHPTRRNGVATSEHRHAGAVNAPANAGCMLLTLTSAIRQ
ncbi:hypothetical protein D0734_22905 [Salmonella enterica]|nr:hypothetical protein [Salmonella enterica]EBJ8637579.1 hypothetical protein [Salmonella enterica]